MALRLSALWTPSTWLLYLCGLLVGGTVWVAYQWWPPRRERRFGGLSLALVGLVIITGVDRLPDRDHRRQAGDHAAVREPGHATCISPAAPGCWTSRSSWVRPEPEQTMIISGFTCKTVTTFSGYRQLGTRTLPVSLSPVTAHTPDGRRISGKIVVAEYPASSSSPAATGSTPRRTS